MSVVQIPSPEVQTELVNLKEMIMEGFFKLQLTMYKTRDQLEHLEREVVKLRREKGKVSDRDLSPRRTKTD